MNSPADLPPIVLIVDDDRATQALLALAMEEEGYQTVGAQNGEQALEEFNRWAPNLVLMDAMMPEMDGFTCCERLRSLPGGKTVPILTITVLDDQESVDRAFSAGTTDYVTKPIYWPVLCQRVRRLVQAGETERQLVTTTEALQQSADWERVITAVLTGPSNSRGTGAVQGHLETVLAIAREALNGDRVGVWLPKPQTWVESISEQVEPVELAIASPVLKDYLKGSAPAEEGLLSAQSWPALASVWKSHWGMVAPVSTTERGTPGGLLIGRSTDKPWGAEDQRRWQELGQLLGLLWR